MNFSDQIKYKKLVEKSKVLFNNKNYEELINTYENIINICSECKFADEYKYHANISYIYEILGKYNDALNYAQNCIKLCPDWYKGYYRAAKASEGLLNSEMACEYYSKIKELVNINDLQKKEQNDIYNVDISVLKKWLQSCGANLGDVEIEYYDVDYRGICVSKTIKPNDFIMKIPLDCVISLEDSKYHGTNAKLLDLGAVYNSPHTHLAISLLDAKYDYEGKYKYYIKCFPKYFGNVPINFNREKLKQLKGSYALVKIAQKIFFLKAEYNNILKLMPTFQYSYEDFVWARTCVITRVYAVDRTIDGKKIKDTILVPFADMANHVMQPNTHWYFDEAVNSFIVKAASYINKGDNLFESYGKKNNYRYFVNYGFTVENNLYDEVAVATNPLLQKLISDGSIKEEMINYINTSCEIFQIGYNKNSAELQKMLKFVSEKCSKILNLEDGISPPADQVYNFIIIIMNNMLNGFDTSLEEDLQILKTYDLGFDMRNCVIQRIGEKKLLHHYINYFRDLIHLENTKNSIEKRKLSKKIEKKYITPYLKEINF